MSTQPPTLSNKVDAFSAVGESFSAGWKRMGWMLFTGPHVNVMTWLTWGFILLIAAPGGGGGSGNFSNRWSDKVDEPHFERSLERALSQVEPWMVALALGLFALVIVIGIVWLYFQSRFRLVMLEGVQSGLPRLRGVFGTTRTTGFHYFVFEIVMALAFLLLAIPVLVAWAPFLMSIYRGDVSAGAELVVPILATVLWLIPVAIVIALIEWWVYDLALPYVVFGKRSFMDALGAAWKLTRERFGAVLLLFIARFLVAALAYCCVIPPVILCSCLLWGIPAAFTIPFIVVTIELPLAAIVTAPIVLVLVLVVIWIISTITAPVPVLFRAWSVAFVNQVDPELPLWAPMNPVPVTPAAPAAPPTEPPAEITPPETS